MAFIFLLPLLAAVVSVLVSMIVMWRSDHHDR